MAPETSSIGPKGQSPLRALCTVCAGKWGTSSSEGATWLGSSGVSAEGSELSCLQPGWGPAKCGGQESWGCIGAKPGGGVCKVWLGRTEGKEEEKSNPLTSKSCTTGISREGGHAATKHRETEITITEATTAAFTQPQS